MKKTTIKRLVKLDQSDLNLKEMIILAMHATDPYPTSVRRITKWSRQSYWQTYALLDDKGLVAKRAYDKKRMAVVLTDKGKAVLRNLWGDD